MSLLFAALAAAGALSLAACAAPPAAATEWRVMVKLSQPGADSGAIVRRAAASSGVPVRYAAAVSAQWHSLALACGDEARCAEALRRLQADTAYFQAVERDERRRPHTAPHPS